MKYVASVFLLLCTSVVLWPGSVSRVELDQLKQLAFDFRIAEFRDELAHLKQKYPEDPQLVELEAEVGGFLKEIITLSETALGFSEPRSVNELPVLNQTEFALLQGQWRKLASLPKADQSAAASAILRNVAAFSQKYPDYWEPAYLQAHLSLGTGNEALAREAYLRISQWGDFDRLVAPEMTEAYAAMGWSWTDEETVTEHVELPPSSKPSDSEVDWAVIKELKANLAKQPHNLESGTQPTNNNTGSTTKSLSDALDTSPQMRKNDNRTQTAPTSFLKKAYPEILFECIDTEDPLLVGDETMYIIQVANQGTAPDHNMRLSVSIPANMKIISAVGDTQGAIRGNQISFKPYAALKPKEILEFRIVVEAIEAGDARLKAALRSDGLKRPLPEEESTAVY